MFDFSQSLNLPLIWGFIIAAAIFFYVLLDGFDLGLGIIFPFAPTEKCRNKMMNSIAPFWDGNETWLVLGGGVLFAAFPLAYSILLPAFYIPIILMLLGLIMRGVAFEFRFKEEGKARRLWDYFFHLGSIIAALCQGLILGAFVQGIKVDGVNYGGGVFDFFTNFSVMTAIAVVFGYCLLGSTWLIMKTEGETQIFARKITFISLTFVAIFMALVSIIMPILNERIRALWFTEPNIYYLLPIPLVTAALFLILWFRVNKNNHEYLPFLISVALFFLGYLGIAISLYPWIIPFQYDIYQCAAANTSLSLLLVAVVPMLPIILVYTGYCYYLFRGKTQHENLY